MALDPPEASSAEVKSTISPGFAVNVLGTLEADSSPTSIDFNPASDTLLLVGTGKGTIGIWDVKYGDRIFFEDCTVWSFYECCTKVQDLMQGKDYLEASVTKVLWCSNPSLPYFGVAFSQHIVHLYRYDSVDHVYRHKEIDAHDGSVNDLAFSIQKLHSLSLLLAITCGDDRKIRVWDSNNGACLYTFDGHNTPVCSICPFLKKDIPFLLSTSTDGNMKTWFYHKKGEGRNTIRPGIGDCKMAYDAADKRLFLSGIIKDEPYFVEWDEVKTCIKRSYKGLRNRCTSIVKFDSTANRILAAGDEHMVKFWDMDNVELLTSTDANGGLLEYPCICFNRMSTLLAVCAKENKIKILEIGNEKLGKQVCIKGSHSNEEWPNYWNVSQICEPYQCQILELPVLSKHKIDRLAYNHAGNFIFALASSGYNVCWIWPHGHHNSEALATTKVPPNNFHRLIRNDLKKKKRKGQSSCSCVAVTSNDRYILSTSGAAINVFDLYTSEPVGCFKKNKPMATSLAFHPRESEIVAIGMDDSSIYIYDVFARQDLAKLNSHSRRVTAVAFSSKFTLLVSGDTDAKICVWNASKWKPLECVNLEIEGERVESDTHIEFKSDGVHFFVAHNTHLGIYDVNRMACDNQVVLEVPITQATLSCDSNTIYAILADGSVRMFDASNLQTFCRINPSAYLPQNPSFSIKPVSIAASPLKPFQFALGLSDGTVKLFDP
ncbi:hypothetical protein PIB30_043521 [Stylosanthes scabra]|uniref:Uncharacterized protein n=1 Tax=Stylosanthes scabra TaxID=79078 RepID=A0ABU6UET8_9FABA|nr:hypothetical protein [Stylosanthes scabra]